MAAAERAHAAVKAAENVVAVARAAMRSGGDVEGRCKEGRLRVAPDVHVELAVHARCPHNAPWLVMQQRAEVAQLAGLKLVCAQRCEVGLHDHDAAQPAASGRAHELQVREECEDAMPLAVRVATRQIAQEASAIGTELCAQPVVQRDAVHGEHPVRDAGRPVIAGLVSEAVCPDAQHVDCVEEQHEISQPAWRWADVRAGGLSLCTSRMPNGAVST